MANDTDKPLGLRNVVSVSMGLIVSMSCLVSLGQGAGEAGLMFIPAMAIALVLNLCSAACMAELNSLMPNATGGLVQYTLAGLGPLPTLVTMVGGYLVCNILCGGVERFRLPSGRRSSRRSLQSAPSWVSMSSRSSRTSCPTCF